VYSTRSFTQRNLLHLLEAVTVAVNDLIAPASPTADRSPATGGFAGEVDVVDLFCLKGIAIGLHDWIGE